MEEKKQLEELAREVLTLARNTLTVNLRYMDAALNRLQLRPMEEKAGLMTDGQWILYHPVHVLRSYKTSREITVRDYLHMVLHCVFHHMYMEPAMNRTYWDLACDIAVEHVITEIGLKSTEALRYRQQQPYISAFQAEMKGVTAERVYAYLQQTQPDEKKVAQIRGLFYSDNHEIWYMGAEEKADRFGLTMGSTDPGDDIQGDWEKISRQIQVDIQTVGKHRGNLPGALTFNLGEVNRERYDYAAFLKKFAVRGEAMRINDEEFDYVYYTYGLQLYRNLPLIEPLEYKEVKAIKEFVVAIDTSGSTSGELVQSFITKTYNILKSTESFFTKINLHIIQCDAAVQEDAKITCQEEFDRYLKTMKLRGGGGTDFRPVFQYVEQLRKRGEFTNLKGLIYFTDGDGVYPRSKPDYETAFVFVGDGCSQLAVPSWAIKLILPREL